jgi:hypothetical protein
MAADNTDQPGLSRYESAPVASPRVRIRWLLAVVAVMALLTAGWPLLNQIVADTRPLAAGSSLTIGPGGTVSARMIIGHGWRLMQAESNPRKRYLLRAGPALLDASTVSLPAPVTDAELWAGMRQLLRVTHSGVTVGRMTPFISPTGQAGLTGPVAGGADAGTATIFIAPADLAALEVVVLAPRSDADRVEAATRLLIQSVTFLSGPVLQRRGGLPARVAGR